MIKAACASHDAIFKDMRDDNRFMNIRADIGRISTSQARARYRHEEATRRAMHEHFRAPLRHFIYTLRHLLTRLALTAARASRAAPI